MLERIGSFYTMDIDKSKWLYDSMKEYILPMQCYRNVFNIVTEYMGKFHDGDWQIFYCYAQIIESNLYARHCAIIDRDMAIIDATYFAVERISKVPKKYIELGILTIDEYMDILAKCNYYPDLLDYYKETDTNLVTNSRKSGLVLIS